MNSAERYMRNVRARASVGDEMIIRRLIQLRDQRPELYRKVPKEWRREVDAFERRTVQDERK